MNSNNGNSLVISRILIYILNIFQAVFYTPVVLSFALFIILIPMLFQQGFTNPLFHYFPDGQYDTARILAVYGKYAFGLSLIIYFIENAFRKRLTFSTKKKMLWLGFILLIGYAFVFVFLTTRAEIDATSALIVLVPFFIFALSAVLISGLMSVLINFLERIFANQR